jgi:hypothetical protein
VSRLARLLAAAAVLLAASTFAPADETAVAARDDVIAVVVDGLGTSSNPDTPWTRVLDADVLAARYGLTAVMAVSVEPRPGGGSQVVITGADGVVRNVISSTFAANQGLPSARFDLDVVVRDTIGGHVALIGDSVGVSIAGTTTSELPILIDGTFDSFTAHVLSTRFISKTPPAPSGLDVARELPLNLDLVIVELGYNPSTNMAADIDAMMKTLAGRGTKRVIWVNMAEILQTATGSSLYGPANAALEAARDRWPTLEIADWNRASSMLDIDRSVLFVDGVHLTATGQAEFAVWLREVITARAGDSDGMPASRRMQPNQRIELTVVGENVVGTDGVTRAIPAGASAVALNITAVTPSLPGFITVWPCDVARPDASNLNYVTGGAVANSVIAPVGASGKVCFYSNQATDFLVDITGWFSGSTNGIETFVGATPRRVIDTRNAIGGPKVRIAAGGTISIPLAGASMQRSDGSPVAIPTDATAVALNVTAVLPSQAGFFTVWPCGAPMPVASNVNFTRGSVVANGVVTSLGAGGAVCLYSDQQSDVLVDVLGWFGGGAQPPFVGAVPSRIVDSRNAVGGPTGVITPSSPRSVPVRGVTVDVNGTPQQVPVDASAVALNVTMVEARAAGFATVWPCGTPMPDASNVNFGRGGTAANGVIAPIGGDGSVCIYTSADAHLIVDIAGWFTGGATPAFTGNIPRRFVDTRNNIGPAPL